MNEEVEISHLTDLGKVYQNNSMDRESKLLNI